MRRFCLIVLIVIFSTASFAETPQAPSPVAREYLQNLEKPIILRGDYFKAVTAAYDDFEQILQKRRAAAESATTAPADRDRLVRLSSIENYDIRVRDTRSSYIVTFGVTFRGEAPLMTMGAGMRYVVDRNSFAINEKAPAK